MVVDSIIKQAELIQNQAWEIIKSTNIISIWENIGAEINLIGSLKTGLMINHRDIDFHIYTRPFNMANSFSAIAKLAENSGIRKISYSNLLDAEDQCLEWHATYIDENNGIWSIDMIHILQDSPYVGYFERVSESIVKALTPEKKLTILFLKNELAKKGKYPAIKIYQAVFDEEIGTVDEFINWYEKQNKNEISKWMP